MKYNAVSAALCMGLLMACTRSSDAPPAEALSPNQPSWYAGTIPWIRLPVAYRIDLVRMHERNPNPKPPVSVRVYEGKQLLARIAKNYGLRDSVQTSTVAGREIVWVPDDLWPQLISKDQEAIKTYASRRSPKWGIGVGPAKDGRIVESRVVFRH